MKLQLVRKKVQNVLKGWFVVRSWTDNKTAMFDIEYPLSICVSLTSEKIKIFLPIFDWPLPYKMTQSFKLYKTLKSTDSSVVIEEAIKEACTTRETTFEVCSGCGRLTTPEQGGARCYSCAEKLDGVVF